MTMKMWVVHADGRTEEREVDRVEVTNDTIMGVQGPSVRQIPRRIPVLQKGERIEWMLGDERPLIVREYP